MPKNISLPDMRDYKNLALKWQDWKTVKEVCRHWATTVFDHIAALEQKRAQ